NAERACVTAGRALQLIGSDMKIMRPQFDVSDFKDLAAPYDNGLLLSNPPYGERLGNKEETESLYEDMAILLQNFRGWDMGFISAYTEFEQKFGKKASAIKHLKSGNLDTVFFMFTNN
ncbi:MAG: class I SAM-dependent RNA methyltransferase, partial [Spirochaetales bacterium]